MEEGQPNFLEQAVRAVLQERDVTAAAVHGKDCLPPAGEYTGEVVLKGLVQFLGKVWRRAREGRGMPPSTQCPRSRPRRRTG